jgi:hypothetical protein
VHVDGNDFQCTGEFCGIGVYASNDLRVWKNLGFLFDPNTPFVQSLCGAPLSGNVHPPFRLLAHWLKRQQCGRPGIVYSEQTKSYVLYVNAGAPCLCA